MYKLLELKSESSKITGYKINIQKSTVFIYTSNEHANTKILKYNTILNHSSISISDSFPIRTCLLQRILHPSSLEEEKKKHKKNHLMQSPNFYFMDMKYPGCYKITTVFSQAPTVVQCVGCSTVLFQPTGRKVSLQKIFLQTEAALEHPASR